MKYYPLSQIKTGLFSKPGEFKILDSSKITPPKISEKIINGDYVGPYIKTSDNKFYTGKSLTDPDGVVELQPLIKDNQDDTRSIVNKGNIVNKRDTIISNIIEEFSPSSYYTHPYDYRKMSKKPLYGDAPLPPKSFSLIFNNEEDEKGIEYRYFCKHKINKNIIETSKEEYTKIINKDKRIQYELYDAIKLKWLLSGKYDNAPEFNFNQIKKAENSGFRGLKNFLKKELNNRTI